MRERRRAHGKKIEQNMTEKTPEKIKWGYVLMINKKKDNQLYSSDFPSKCAG